MVAIVQAVQDGTIPDSSVAIVVSDRSKAPGLEKARALGIETVVVARRGRDRAEHDAEIIGELRKRDVELVCLAGYMRLISTGFVREFPHRIVNIHPSLLPSFKGLDAQHQAVEYGVRVSGCTVHFVDEELDHGAIILQKAVDVLDSDDADSLSGRILSVEHETYTAAVRKLVSEPYRIEGRRVIFG